MEVSDTVQATAARHIEVQDQHVGHEFAQTSVGLLQCGALRNHIEAVVAREQRPQATAHDRVAIGDDDSYDLWRKLRCGASAHT